MSNLRDWLRKNYDIEYMETENGALGMRRKASAALQAFGGGKASDAAYERISVLIPSILAHMRSEGVPGTKHALTQAAHSLGIDHEQKRLDDLRIQRHERSKL